MNIMGLYERIIQEGMRTPQTREVSKEERRLPHREQRKLAEEAGIPVFTMASSTSGTCGVRWTRGRSIICDT